MGQIRIWPHCGICVSVSHSDATQLGYPRSRKRGQGRRAGQDGTRFDIGENHVSLNSLVRKWVLRETQVLVLCAELKRLPRLKILFSVPSCLRTSLGDPPFAGRAMTGERCEFLVSSC